MPSFLRRVILGSLLGLTSMVFAENTYTALSSGISSSDHTPTAKKTANPKFHRFSGHHMIVSKGGNAFRGFYFLFVDNARSLTPAHGRRSFADGSYQHPYRTLAEAEANSEPDDIIYVFPGDGTTMGMDSGIALQADQHLWGAGMSHVLHTSRGSVTIPAMASSAPKITNTAGDGITLATDNDISGFVLSDVISNGVFGNNPQGVAISSCTIGNSQLDQIHLEYSASSGSVTLDSLTITNGSLNGIFIDSSVSSSMECRVNNCVIQGCAISSIDASFSNAVSVLLTNNTIAGNGSSSRITMVGPSTLLVSGNTFTNNTSIDLAPLLIITGTNAISAVVASNNVSGNTCGAMHFILNDGESVLSLTDNTVTNNGTGAIGTLGAAIFIDPNNTSAGSCNLVLSNNTIAGNGGDALFAFNGGFNDLQVTASDNRVIGNGGGGYVFANACNTFTLTAINNTISGGGDHGITTGGGLAMITATVTVSNNQITGNNNFANGIALSHAGSTLNLNVMNNDISGNDSSGILLYASDPIESVIAKIENNTITNNQNTGSNASGGIDLEQFTDMCGDLNDNVLTDNVGGDVFIGSTEATPSVCLEMSGNNSGTGYILSSGTGVFNLAPLNAASANVGTITESGPVTLVESCICSP